MSFWHCSPWPGGAPTWASRSRLLDHPIPPQQTVTQQHTSGPWTLMNYTSWYIKLQKASWQTHDLSSALLFLGIFMCEVSWDEEMITTLCVMCVCVHVLTHVLLIITCCRDRRACVNALQTHTQKCMDTHARTYKKIHKRNESDSWVPELACTLESKCMIYEHTHTKHVNEWCRH